jgi:transcriptional regulator GlxA family with amidase domain
MRDRYPELKDWIRRQHQAGSTIYSACSGSVLLAATGLLNNRQATSHWGYTELFRNSFPDVRFNPEPSLVFADPAGRIVTAGGTTSWHDLAIHIISRHCSPGEALRITVGYENAAFFRRLFKRCTGLTAGEYRRMFRPISRGVDLAAKTKTIKKSGSWSA